MEFGGRNCTGVSAPAYLSFFTASVSLVLFLVTSVGNLLACLTVYKDPNKQLRTPFNLFVVNLACADLIVGFVVAPIFVVMNMQEGLAVEVSEHDFSVLHMSCFVACMASVLSLTALAIDRHIAITFPLYYRATAHTKKMVAVFLIIWTISASVPFVYFKVGFISYAFVFKNVAVVLTLAILVVSYASILRKMRHRSQVFVQLQAGRSKITSVRRADKTRESRLTKAFLIMLVAFLSSYIPSCAMIYIMKFCPKCSCYSIHWLRDMNILFVLLNSCLNPVVYAWRIPVFRNALLSIIGRRPIEVQTSGKSLPSTSNRAFYSDRCESVGFNAKPDKPAIYSRKS